MNLKPQEHVAEVRGQKSPRHPEHICKYIVPLLDLPEGTKLFLNPDQDSVEKYWKPEVSKLAAEILKLNAQLAQPDVEMTNGGEAVAWFFRHNLDTGNGWIDNYRDLSDERPNPAYEHFVNVHEIVPLCYKGDFDALQLKLNKALEALAKIAAIEDQYNCGDWDEIEEARDIANAALTELNKE